MSQTEAPRHSKEAERYVLGSCLRHNDVIPEVVQRLRTEQFYVHAHRLIFDAIVTIHDQGGPVDVVLLTEFLNNRKQIDDVGGYPYLGDLLDDSPTAGNVIYYAKIVRDKAILRGLTHLANETARDAAAPSGPPDELMERLDQRVLALAQDGVIREPRIIRTLIDEVWAEFDELSKKNDESLSGIPSGFSDLDYLTKGWQNSEFIVIAARPGIGKTALALNMTRDAILHQGLSVLFISLEMADKELVKRLLSCEAEVDSQKFKNSKLLTPEEINQLIAAGHRLKPTGLIVEDDPNLNMLRLAALARRFKRRPGISRLVVDYMQLVEPDDRRARREEQVAGISRRLKRLAKELKIPVIALAQLNRLSEERSNRKPKLSDLRESGASRQTPTSYCSSIEPDVVTEPGKPPAPTGIVQAIIAKNRNGRTGEVTLIFRKEFQRFENYVPD